jgi:hypothetical protein
MASHPPSDYGGLEVAVLSCPEIKTSADTKTTVREVSFGSSTAGKPLAKGQLAVLQGIGSNSR